MCILQIGDAKMKQRKEFKYAGNILTEDEICDTEIRSQTRITKAFCKSQIKYYKTAEYR